MRKRPSNDIQQLKRSSKPTPSSSTMDISKQRIPHLVRRQRRRRYRDTEPTTAQRHPEDHGYVFHDPQ